MTSKDLVLTVVEVEELGDGASILRTADGRERRVELGAQSLVAILAAFEPALSRPALDPRRTMPSSGALQDLIHILNEGGSLGPSLAKHGHPSLVVVGDDPLADAVCRHKLDAVLDSACRLDLANASAWPAVDLVLVVAEQPSAPLFGTAEVALIDRPWLPLSLSDNAVTFGPMMNVGIPYTIGDLDARLLAAAKYPPEENGDSPRRLGTVWATEAELAFALAVLTSDLRRFFGGEPYRSNGNRVVIRPRMLSIEEQPVLPLPSTRLKDRVDFGPKFGWTALVHPRTGIITRLRKVDHHPSIPSTLITVQAELADMRRVSPWLTDPVAAGTSFRTRKAATEAAVGEAVERYSGEIVQADQIRHGSWNDLQEDGSKAVDPTSLVLFSDEQYASKGFPFVPLTRDLPIYWVAGWSLTRNTSAWLPASLVYPNWHTDAFEHEPHTNNPFFPGLAAGPSLDFAIASGIQEVIERHATMVWWAHRQPLSGVIPTPDLQAIWNGTPMSSGQRAWLIHLDNEFDVPVMAGMVRHEPEQLFTMGFAARPDAESAALKAWAEALTLQDGCRDLLNPTGAYRKAAHAGRVNGRFVKPWRADRRYLHDYRRDFRDVVDLWCQLQIHLDPDSFEAVKDFVDPPPSRSLSELPRLPDGSRTTYQERVERKGYEIFYADVTTRDVAMCGMKVVRVLIPGLVPNYAAAFPFLGRHALTTAGTKLGWRNGRLGEDEINLFPMAHA